MAKGDRVPAPVLVEHVVEVAGLDPRHEGVRIAHLSDIHVGDMTPRRHVRAAIDLANSCGADVIALTGDYVSWRRYEVEMAEEQLAGLSARRVVATLGNHDYFTSARGMIRALEKHGYDVLRNQHTVVEVGGAPLSLIGIDDPVTHHHDLERSYHGVDRGTRVVLCHCPEEAPEIADRGADLVLSGHTHGGQIYLRGVTDHIIRRMGRRFRHGFYDIGERTQLYVTPGVGFSGITWRKGHGTAAEVAVFTLRAAPVAEAA